MFNIKLKKMRKKFGLTQSQLAKKLGLSASTIGMYEQGRREPDSKILIKIANLFNLSVDYFLDTKKSKRRAKNAEEIVNRIKTILNNKNGVRKEVDKKTLDAITQAVCEGLKEALIDDE